MTPQFSGRALPPVPSTLSITVRCNRLLCAALPDDGISTGVKDREQHDSRGFNAEENGVWEATRPNAPNIPVHDRKALWVLGNQANGTLYLRDKLCAEADATLLVPQRGVVELAARYAPKDDRTNHRLRRSAIDAFASSQETTSFGFAS